MISSPGWVCLTSGASGPRSTRAWTTSWPSTLRSCCWRSVRQSPGACWTAMTFPPSLTQGSERRPQLLREQLRLFPGSKVAALVDLVEVRDVRVARFDPAARRPPDLAWEGREGERDRRRGQGLAACGGGVGAVGLPVRPGGGGAAAGQPVQRDVVEDVVAREVARGPPVDERVGDLVVRVGVVVDHPGGEGDRRVQQGVADRLRPGGHLDE